MGAENQEINKQEEVIKNAVSDKFIQEKESSAVDTANNSLKEIKKNLKDQEKLNNKINDIEKKYKPEIAKGIFDYLDKKEILLPEAGKVVVDNIKKINDINQIISYENLIKWIESDKTDQFNFESIKQGLKDQKLILEGKENTKKLESLNDLLESDANMERAQTLFENNSLMRNNLFNNIDTNNQLTLGTEKQKKNFSQLLHYYGGCKTEDNGKTWEYPVNGEGKKVTNLTYKIIKSNGSDGYSANDQYIKIDITINGVGAITKDIMFGKASNTIELARAKNSFEKVKKEKSVTIELNQFHKNGSYEYLRSLVTNKKVDLTKELRGDILEHIKDFYEKNKANPNIENKEDGYYTTIAELVRDQAKEGKNEALQEYLLHVNKDHLNGLGRNKAEQEKNFKILLTAVTNNPNYNANSEVRKDINNKLADIREQILPQQDFMTQMKNGIKPFMEKYGDTLIKFLNFLGVGKNFLYKICKALKMDLKEVDEYYEKAYGLSEEATEASKKIEQGYNKQERKKNTDSTPIKPTDPSSLKTIFSDRITNFPGTGNEDDFIKNTNPALLSNLIDQYNNDSKNKDHKINKQDILVNNKDKDGKEKLEIKKDAIRADGQKQLIIDTLLNDDNTRNTIREANRKIDGYPRSKTDPELTRSDLLPGKRNEMKINNPSDMVKYLNYYAFSGKTGDLDYVITETKKIDGKKDIGNGEEQKPVELKFKDTKDFTDNKINSTGANKPIHEIIDMANPPDRIKIIDENGTAKTAVKKEGFTDTKYTNVTTYVWENQQTERAIIKKNYKIEAIIDNESSK